MSWETEVARDRANVRFFAQVEGVPYLFIDGPGFIAPDGATAWTAPTSGGQSYTVLPHTLDVSDGIRDDGAQVIRRTSKVTPGRLTLTLADNRAGDLLSLFAQQRITGSIAQLTASLAYDTTGAGSIITVDDTSTFDAAGLLYLGRETMYSGAKTSGAFGTGGTKVVRGLFSVGDSDTQYTYRGGHATAPQIISDHVRVWYGRYVRLFAVLCGDSGNAYDAAYYGTYSREIYRGIITVAAPLPDPTWMRWAIPTRGLSEILQTEIGRHARKATIVGGPYPPVASQSTADSVEGEAYAGAGSGFGWGFFLSDSTRRISLTIANGMGGEATTVESLEIEIVDEPTWVTTSHLGEYFTEAVTTAAHLTTTSLLFSLVTKGKQWGVKVENSGTDEWWMVTIDWEAAGSIGKLLGFPDGQSELYVGSPDGPFFSTWHVYGTGEHLFAYIGEDDSVFPVWFDNPGSIVSDTPVTPGYAKIGDEIIQYTTITSAGDPAIDWVPDVEGLYVIEGCTRGRLGTTRQAHPIPMTTTAEQMSAGARVVFGVGFIGSIFDLILQLAVSTGNAAHHGSHDVLGALWSPPLNPNHFDTDSFERFAEMAPALQRVAYWTAKPSRLATLASKLLQPLGLYLVGRPVADGTYRIAVVEVMPPLESESTVGVGTAQIATTGTAYLDSTASLVNVVEARPWDAAREREDDTRSPVIVTYDDSVANYGVKGRIKWSMIGRTWDVAQAEANILDLAITTFARFGDPYRLLKLTVDRIGWTLVIGDTVTVTVPALPNMGGTRGFTDRAMVVVAIRYFYWGGLESSKVGAELTVEDSAYHRRSTYCPALNIASRASAVLTAGTVYNRPGNTVPHFDAGDQIILYDRGNYDATKTTGAITAVTLTGAGAINTATVSGGAASYTVTANTVMVSQPYSGAATSQKAHAYIADNASTPVLSTADATSFKYI